MNGKAQHLYSVLASALLAALLLSSTAQARLDDRSTPAGPHSASGSTLRPDDRAGQLGPGGVATVMPDVIERQVKQQQASSGWEFALRERSAALNARYGLGGDSGTVAVRPDDRGEIRGPGPSPVSTVSATSSSTGSSWVDSGYVTIAAFALAFLTSAALLVSRRRHTLAH